MIALSHERGQTVTVSRIAVAEEYERDLDTIMRASRVITGIIAQSVAQTEDAVTLPQLRALVLVATRTSVNASAIAAALDIHPSNASRLLDRLVQAGLLDRQESPTDRRHVALTLTPRGSRLVASVMAHRRAAYLRILGTMGAAERRRLSRALEEFADAAGEPDEDALLGLGL